MKKKKLYNFTQSSQPRLWRDVTKKTQTAKRAVKIFTKMKFPSIHPAQVS